MAHIIIELTPGQQLDNQRAPSYSRPASPKLFYGGGVVHNSNNSRFDDTASDIGSDNAFLALGRVESPAVEPLPPSHIPSKDTSRPIEFDLEASSPRSFDYSERFASVTNDSFAVAPSASRSGLSARFADQLLLRIKHADERRKLQMQHKIESRNALQSFGSGSRRISVAVMGLEGDILKLVLLREEHLRALQDLCNSYEAAAHTQTTTKTFASRDTIKVVFLQCADRLRGTTIEVVEAVVQWRKTLSVEGKAAKVGNRSAKPVFMWKGENYLIKITQDLAFLDRDFVRRGLGIHAADNPLLLPESTRHLLPLELLERCECALAYLRAEAKPNLSKRASATVAPEKLEDAIDTLAQQAEAQKLSKQLRQRQERPSTIPRARAARVHAVAPLAVAPVVELAVTWPAQRESVRLCERRGLVSDKMDADFDSKSGERGNGLEAMSLSGAEILVECADPDLGARAKTAAVGIQRVARGFVQRREVKLRLRPVSSRHASDEAFVQGMQEASGYFRGLVDSFQGQDEDGTTAKILADEPAHVIDEPGAAIKIPTGSRKHTAQKEVAKIREEENAAASKLQATQRRYNAKICLHKRRTERDKAQMKDREDNVRAALRIQSVQRGRAVRNEADKIKPLPSLKKSTNVSIVRAARAAEHASTSALEAATVFSKLAQEFGSPQWSPKPASPPPALKFRTRRRGLLREYDEY